MITALGEGFAVLADLDPVTREGRLDLFDRGGQYQGSVDYHDPGQFIHGVGNKLYAVGYGADEDIVVKRFSIEEQ